MHPGRNATHAGRNPVHPGCSPMHPGCNPMHPGRSPTQTGCSPTHPGCNLGLQVWILLVLAAEAPAVAGQVLCSRHISRGNLPAARTLLLRLLRRTALLGGATSLFLLGLAGPASSFLIPSDAATREVARCLFGWAAICTPLVAPNALCEAVLLGAGRSYKYLALATLTSALSVMGLTGLALTVRPQVSTVWLGITLFFVVRLTTSAGRIFSGRGGFGQWWP